MITPLHVRIATAECRVNATVNYCCCCLQASVHVLHLSLLRNGTRGEDWYLTLSNSELCLLVSGLPVIYTRSNLILGSSSGGYGSRGLLGHGSQPHQATSRFCCLRPPSLLSCLVSIVHPACDMVVSIFSTRSLLSFSRFGRSHTAQIPPKSSSDLSRSTRLIVPPSLCLAVVPATVLIKSYSVKSEDYIAGRLCSPSTATP